jgi:hypothetical protein
VHVAQQVVPAAGEDLVRGDASPRTRSSPAAGDDLLCDVHVPMTAAALGTRLDLPTLEADTVDGDPADSDVELTVPLDVRAGTQSGEQISVRGRGVPRLRGGGRGDLIVRVVVDTPIRLDGEQEELLQRLAEIRHETRPNGQFTPSHKACSGSSATSSDPADPWPHPSSGARRWPVTWCGSKGGRGITRRSSAD